MDNKSQLLNQLKIDRSEEENPGRISPLVIILLMAFSAAVGGAGVWAISGGENGGGQGKISSATAGVPSSDTAPATNSKVTPDSVKNNNQDVPEKILNASGYITARRMATVSAKVLGLITEVDVEEGMTVKRGQILARLDSAEATVNLNYALAQQAATETRIGRIKANLTEAKRVLKRSKELNSSNYSSEAVLSRAQAAMESLEADLLTAKADIKVAKLEVARQRERLKNYTIRAPFDGVVTVKNAQPGEIVAPSSAGGGFTRTGICTIVDMNSLEIEVDVNEAFIGRVFEGQKVEANLDAYPDWTIPATVIAVIPTADRAKATVRVRIRIESKDPRILPDMGVKVAFLKN